MLQNPHVLFTFDKIDNPLHLPRGTTSEPPKVARTCGVLSMFASNCASPNNSVRFFDISTSKSGPVLRCFIHVDFEMCFAPQRHALFRHRNFQKWSDTEVLYILTSKCASRHNGMHFFDIATSKRGPRLRCFVHFPFEMCFAPQRHALFRHRNFQKWSEAEVFCTFSLRNVLRATTACTFSCLMWPAGSAPAALASLLFDPPEPQIIGKHSVSRLSYLFAHLHLLSSNSFSSLIFSLLLSSSLCLCPALLFICPYCRKFDF